MSEAVRFVDVTKDNFDEVIKLSVRDDQKGFVASNVYSLAEAKVIPEYVPLAVYAGGTLVGFAMYGYWVERGEHWIARLMVDQRFQGKGYGREAMRLLVERMRSIPGCDKIMISYDPDNDAARKLYAGLGFEVTGEMIDSEEAACLRLKA